MTEVIVGRASATPELGARLRRKTRPERGDKQYGRSAITNGHDLLPGVTDKRAAVYRRFKDITNALVADQGGIEHCSESRLQLIRRFSAAAVLAEQMEARLANGEEISVSEHSVLSSTLVRLASRIGLSRNAKDVTPSLADYLQSKEVRSESEL
jgi:hypothetical protein